MDSTGTTSEWEADRLDVRAYLEHLGIDGTPAADLATLRQVHRAHTLAIPFENLDIVLGRDVPLDLDRLQSKLLGGRRGGYCYEHNLLLAALLDRLGYRVARLQARPLLNAGRPLSRTHLTLLVETEDGPHLADVGFGDTGPLEPLPLDAGGPVGTPAGPDGWVHRLHRAAGAAGAADRWELHQRRGDVWYPLYGFTSEPHHHVDCVVANHFTSTHPRSPFTGRVFAGRITPDARLNLDRRRLTVSRADGTVEVNEVTDRQFPGVLENDFGITLSPDELRTVLRSLPAPGAPRPTDLLTS